MWKSITSLILSSLIYVSLSSQVDTALFQANQHKQFFYQDDVNQEINPISFDINLLNRSLFHAINEYRVRKGKEVLQFDANLYEISRNYQKDLESKKFNNPSRYKKKLMKTVYKDAKSLSFKGSLLNINIASGDFLNYNGKKFYYDRRDESTKLRLFYGEKPRLSDKDQSRVSIPFHTYASLARSIVKKMNKEESKQNNKSKAYRFIGVYVKCDYRTLYKKTIPQLKVISVFGGYQTDLLKDALEAIDD